MSTAQQGSTGGGLFSKLVVAVLLAVTVALYLRIVMVDSAASPSAPGPQASVQVLEGNEAASAPMSALIALPDDQMQLIMQVFAPKTAP